MESRPQVCSEAAAVAADSDKPTDGFNGSAGERHWNLQRGRHLVFRWFEELGPICELLEKASEIEASKIKLSKGSIFQKYVYSSFMVKMRIDLGSFGLFWFILGWG